MTLRTAKFKLLETVTLQVKLLKEGKDIPQELAEKIKESKTKAEMALPQPVALSSPGGGASSDQVEMLKAKASCNHFCLSVNLWGFVCVCACVYMCIQVLILKLLTCPQAVLCF